MVLFQAILQLPLLTSRPEEELEGNNIQESATEIDFARSLKDNDYYVDAHYLWLNGNQRVSLTQEVTIGDSRYQVETLLRFAEMADLPHLEYMKEMAKTYPELSLIEKKDAEKVNDLKTELKLDGTSLDLESRLCYYKKNLTFLAKQR